MPLSVVSEKCSDRLLAHIRTWVWHLYLLSLSLQFNLNLVSITTKLKDSGDSGSILRYWICGGHNGAVLVLWYRTNNLMLQFQVQYTVLHFTNWEWKVENNIILVFFTNNTAAVCQLAAVISIVQYATPTLSVLREVIIGIIISYDTMPKGNDEQVTENENSFIWLTSHSKYRSDTTLDKQVTASFVQYFNDHSAKCSYCT